jgi:hypothetical protein
MESQTFNMKSPCLKLFFVLFVLLISGFIPARSQTGSAGISSEQFLNPPASARPRVWWHWMNGNITEHGIHEDLMWMHRAGIGGFQNFDASLGTPQIVEKRLSFMTPEWKDAFYFTAKLADSLHLEMAIAGSPGWSESGGPWVAPQDGMKKITWSETRVKGGQTINIVLPAAPAVTGTFQNIQAPSGPGLMGDIPKPPVYFKDVAVMAYKLPANDIPLSELKPIISSSAGQFNLAQLTDGDLQTTNMLPSDSVKGWAWIQFAFADPQTIKAVTVVGGGDRGPFGLNGELKDTRSLEASDDGINFKFVSFIPAGEVLQQTILIPETKAKYFRIKFKNPPTPFSFASMMGGGGAPKPPAGTDIAEINLYTATRINRFEEKDAFAPAGDLAAYPTPVSSDTIASADIINLTDKMKSDGTLSWEVPAGNWVILRFGFSLIGITNHPASPEATGLEVDKLDPVAISKYFENYLDQYQNATKGLMGNKGGLQFMVTDSWEAGAQNWTMNMEAEFQKRRGYSMLPWMPVLTGHIVVSSAASEQFLWDYRKTLSELVAIYHYDQLTAILQKYGMKRYSESHESGRALIADGMEVKRKAAVPMSAMWTPSITNGGDQTSYQADIRESASVSHLYGQNLVAAESLTAFGIGGNAWSYSPEKLKPTADLELASGLNRFVIHTSVHQPVDDKIPGLGLGPFGQWFTRNETWAEQAKVWTDYLSRSSYMLQQGKFVADVLYYYGEDNNITSLFGKKLPAIPEGYNYDFVNSDALINLISVKDGKIVTPSGMSYRLLVLDSNATKMSLPVLRRLRDLVKSGAAISGVKPTGSPSLSDDPVEYNRILHEIWGAPNERVMSGKDMSAALASLNVVPDFTYSKPSSNAKILYVHRKLPNSDIYWLDNRNDRVEKLEATFRVEGKIPEIWHAETGNKTPVSYNIENGLTKVELTLQPNEAVFVVFKDPATKSSFTLAPVTEKSLLTLSGDWDLSFQKDRGAPAAIKINALGSWTGNTDPGIKYFSGTGTYTKTFDASADWFAKGARLILDLGDVKNLAEVFLNGKPMGILWRKPFLADITHALKPGTNTLVIKVTNLWVNRLIGDQQPDVTKKITYTTIPFYNAKSPLLPSGLMGPVQIILQTE